MRYEIDPPESLRSEYLLKLAQKNVDLHVAQSTHLDKVYEKFGQKIAWWEKDFPKGAMPAPKRSESRDEIRAMSIEVSPRPVGMAAPSEAVSPTEEMVSTTSAREARVVNVDAEPDQVTTGNERVAISSTSIQLKKWESDAAYIKNLRSASPENMYRIYLDERPNYVNSTAFFLDAADIFIERKQLVLGLRILSNLAEMNLEDRHILRILAYRLLQAKQAQLALPVLQQVLMLSPNEPQSFRDLGLAYAENQQYQFAVDNLWEVVVRPWHDRFPDIELISLAEMNSIISRVPKNMVLDTNKIDPRLLRNFPLDLRAVLSWDADNADIDLWVTDPNGEKVYFANRLGFQGGRMSQDFTGGYGPEEFSLHKAKPGKYKVQAHFYGNHQQIVSGYTTLMLKLSTGFGTLKQKDENVILRLSGQGDDVEIGTFEVGARSTK